MMKQARAPDQEVPVTNPTPEPAPEPAPEPGTPPPAYPADAYEQPGYAEYGTPGYQPPVYQPPVYPAPYGAAVPAYYDPTLKSRTAAGLLGIFLGGFGVHRFYLGYVSIGILQIIVTILTCGLGSIWGLVEGIMILAGSGITTDAEGRPLRE